MGEWGIKLRCSDMPPLVIERKVKGGKLFRLKINWSEDAPSFQLTGDFFMEPEEGIEIIERTLADCLSLSDKGEAERRLAATIALNDISISGFEAKDLIDALWEAK